MLLFFILTFLYALLLIALIISWEKIPLFFSDPGTEKKTKITVVVAVRNEGENIIQLLSDLNQQKYPYNNFEVIVADDFSTDDTVQKVKSYIPQSNFTLRVLEHSGESHLAGKKFCIQKAIEASSGDLIVTTDGDCRVGNNWLSEIENFYSESGCKMISGPVTFFESDQLFKSIQTIEFASLIGSGAASLNMGFPNMCNGANLAYEKKAFYEVNGFAGNEHVASGDDEFLMHKIFQKFPGKVMFLKSKQAIVSTAAKENLKDFASQRRRWASKWGHYQFNSIKMLAAFIFLYNLTLLCCLILTLLGQFSGVPFLETFLIKILLEFVFLKRIVDFIGRKIGLFPFIIIQMIYPLYVVFFALGSLKGNYDWKGRKINPQSFYE